MISQVAINLALAPCRQATDRGWSDDRGRHKPEQAQGSRVRRVRVSLCCTIEVLDDASRLGGQAGDHGITRRSHSG
jgi:hypothetical protein